MLVAQLPTDLFAFLLVFVRMGAVVMLLPGFGEAYITPRIRLVVALGLALVLTPLVAPLLPPLPASPMALLLLIGGEVLTGAFFGVLARLLMSALQMAGMAISYQMGLANAFSFDPTSAAQGALLGTFLAVMGVLLVFASGMHHLMLAAAAQSYELFVPGAALPIGEMAESVSRVAALSFGLATQMASPFIVVGLLFYLGLGILGRLMPQVQVFFIALPLQVGLGFLVLALSLSAVMMWFLSVFEDTFLGLVG